MASALVLCACEGCGRQSLAEKASGDMEGYEQSAVNAIEQARPVIMVLPSDNVLKRNHALSTQTVGGREVVVRNYQQYLLAATDNKSLLSTIQDAFVQQGYPLQDLEQTLKQLDTQAATDMADDLAKDTKTMLLTVAQPDMIIELDYATTVDIRRPVASSGCTASFTMNVLDAYTSQVLSSSSQSNLNGASVAEALQPALTDACRKMTGDITAAFSDMLTRGRNVSVRVGIAGGCTISLDDESILGDTYTDWIIDYMKAHTVKGAYKMQRNTSKELYFVNCRIPLLNDDGTQYSSYDWARDMGKDMRRDLGLSVSNKSQGLGEILVTINGLK